MAMVSIVNVLTLDNRPLYSVCYVILDFCFPFLGPVFRGSSVGSISEKQPVIKLSINILIKQQKRVCLSLNRTVI